MDTLGQLNSNAAFEAEYTHVLGLHGNKTMNIDQKIPIDGVLTRPLDDAYAAIHRFRIGYRPVFAMKKRSAATITTASISASVQRMAARFQLQANYTLAWAYGYGSGGGSFRNYPKLATAPFASWEWGPSPNDERHHITVAGVVDLPKGFEIAPIMQYGSARPFDLTNSSNTLNTGGGTAVGVVVPTVDPTDWFAFAGDDTGAQNCFYGIGTARQAAPSPNTIRLRGDPFFQLDARLAKNFKFGDGPTCRSLPRPST